MKTIQSNDDHVSGDSWHKLGGIELSIGSDADSAINSWLTGLLSPLSLSTDFLSRFYDSVQGTVMRFLHPNVESLTENGHIHLSIFVPHERFPERKTWGFFHIERIENQAETVDAHDHAIDFYLYVEG